MCHFIQATVVGKDDFQDTFKNRQKNTLETPSDMLWILIDNFWTLSDSLWTLSVTFKTFSDIL